MGTPELIWRKSSRSPNNGPNCVEVADLPGGQKVVRNSRYPEMVLPAFTPGEWKAFIEGVQNNEFPVL